MIRSGDETFYKSSSGVWSNFMAIHRTVVETFQYTKNKYIKLMLEETLEDDISLKNTS